MDCPCELDRVLGSQTLEKFDELRQPKDGMAVISGDQPSPIRPGLEHDEITG